MTELNPDCTHKYIPNVCLREDLSTHQFTCFECCNCGGILQVAKNDKQPFNVLRKWADLNWDENITGGLEADELPSEHEFIKQLLPTQY